MVRTAGSTIARCQNWSVDWGFVTELVLGELKGGATKSHYIRFVPPPHYPQFFHFLEKRRWNWQCIRWNRADSVRRGDATSIQNASIPGKIRFWMPTTHFTKVKYYKRLKMFKKMFNKLCSASKNPMMALLKYYGKKLRDRNPFGKGRTHFNGWGRIFTYHVWHNSKSRSLSILWLVKKSTEKHYNHKMPLRITHFTLQQSLHTTLPKQRSSNCYKGKNRRFPKASPCFFLIRKSLVPFNRIFRNKRK